MTGADNDEFLLEVGVGPWEGQWPDDPRYDPNLLRDGDRRNVVDRYRYWRREAVVADLDTRRHDFHVAIENWQHDMNIGTVVRTANAFLAREVHIVGRRRWNRRGAMVTDRYQHVRHHADIAELLAYAGEQDLTVVAVDNLPGAVPLETTTLPRRSLLLFGQEGPGLSEPAREAADLVCSIAQYGSTRSINAGVASGIAMHAWIRAHGAPLYINRTNRRMSFYTHSIASPHGRPHPQVDSGQLAQSAGQVLSAAGALANVLAASRNSLIVPPTAFGNSVAGPAVHDSHAAVLESGAATVERLVEVLEGDVDRIYRVAFAYQRMEQENAARSCRGTPGGGDAPC